MPLFITPTCPFCGKKGNVVLNEEQISKHVAYTKGEIRFIQDAFPELSAPVREQLKTGIHPECWDNAFGDDEDEYNEYDNELEDEEPKNLTAQETLNSIFGVIMNDIWQNSKE